MAEESPRQFIHSVKVPNKFKTAAKFISNAIKQGISLKTQLYTSNNERARGLVHALLRKIVQYKEVLDDVIEKCGILKQESRMDPYLCLVLTAELLFGSGLSDLSKPSLCVQTYRDQMFELLQQHKNVIEELKSKPEAQPTPRYVRVNTNLLSRTEAIEEFIRDGWEVVDTEIKTYDEFLAAVGGLSESQYLSDIHIHNLFVFPPASKQYWARHPLVKASKIILQDKASCLSSFLLDPPRGSVVLDMCAAPGMKTSHLASIMKNRGTIFAVEYNEHRYHTLLEFVANTKSTIVRSIHADAMQVNPDTLKNKVEYILLDPPCSGSGMDNRLSLFNESAERKRPAGDRLFQLGGLQIRMLMHAMKDFPHAKRIVYSTCSNNPEENEHVIQRALEMVSDQNWELVKPIEFAEKWKNFGSPKYKHIGKKCVYAVPEVDRTTGFFVAMLERNFGDKPAYTRLEKIPIHLLANPFVKHSNPNAVSHLDNDHGDCYESRSIPQNPFKTGRVEPHQSNNTEESEETGDLEPKPKKNRSVNFEVGALAESDETKSRQNRKKEMKDSTGREESNQMPASEQQLAETSEKKKKKKKDKDQQTIQQSANADVLEPTELLEPKLKKKKKREKEVYAEETVEVASISFDEHQIDVESNKKKKRKRSTSNLPAEKTTCPESVDMEIPIRKHKKSKHHDAQNQPVSPENGESVKKKKKSEKKSRELD